MKKVLAFIALSLAAACGPAPAPEVAAPQPGGGGGGQDDGWAAVAPVVQRTCGGCHNGSTHPLKLDTAAAFKASKSKARISNNTMPPGGGLAPADKTAMLDYLGT